MSLSAASDLSLFDMFTVEQYIAITVTSFVVLALSALKAVFGSYSVPHILREYNRSRREREYYLELFDSRNILLYHINKAKENGDDASLLRLMKELDTLDAIIDGFEDRPFNHDSKAV